MHLHVMKSSFIFSFCLFAFALLSFNGNCQMLILEKYCTITELMILRKLQAVSSSQTAHVNSKPLKAATTKQRKEVVQ